MKRKLMYIASGLIAFILLVFLFLRVRYGGGEHFEDRSTPPLWQPHVLEKVIDLAKPPGNIAVSKSNRVFFTFHPEGGPDVKVAEIVESQVKPYPSMKYQNIFSTPLSVRIDLQNRLWVLDLANHALGQPTIYAFSLETNTLLFKYEIPAEVAPLGSHMNDMQIDGEGNFMYIADASIFAKSPALIVFDIEKKQSWRLLENHESVKAEHFITRVGGRDMVVLGVFAIRPNVDSIALDRRNKWLYYAAVNARYMYRIETRHLLNRELSPEQRAGFVEKFAAKTHSDGITIDNAENIYLTDPEHNALHVIEPNGDLKTLVKSENLRWPDGFSFGPDNYIYVTCSALHHVIFKSSSHQKEQSPYQIYRFKALAPATAGH